MPDPHADATRWTLDAALESLFDLPATAKWPKGAFGVQPFANADASLSVFAPRGEDRHAADFDRAQMRSDAAELQRLLADDHVLYNSSGKVEGKAEFIRDYAGMKLQPFTVEDETIHPRLRRRRGAGRRGEPARHRIASGEAFSSRLRFADVWRRRDGRRQVAFTRATRAAAP